LARTRPASPAADSAEACISRATELTGADLLIREVDPGPPVGVRYRLAPRGEALVPELRDLMDWARGNLQAAE
jgi:DNA-binding HxlR family transcriptional regulator